MWGSFFWNVTYDSHIPTTLKLRGRSITLGIISLNMSLRHEEWDHNISLSTLNLYYNSNINKYINLFLF